jgi:hypothetical protein
MAKVTAQPEINGTYLVYGTKSEAVFIDNEKDTVALIAILKGMTQNTADACLSIMAKDPFVRLKEEEALNQPE